MNIKAYIAGAFGAYINPANTKAIGMIPAVPLKIITNVGNSAGTGARMALVSAKVRERCEENSNRVEYIELAARPSFHPIFMESLRFPKTQRQPVPENGGSLEKAATATLTWEDRGYLARNVSAPR